MSQIINPPSRMNTAFRACSTTVASNWKGVVAVGLPVLVAAFLYWMGQRFVTLESYEKDKKVVERERKLEVEKQDLMFSKVTDGIQAIQREQTIIRSNVEETQRYLRDNPRRSDAR
jgi:capsular polysaccharide biosynthesis protein